MPKYSLDDLYNEVLRTLFFKNDSQSALRKLKKCREVIESSAMEDTPLMFRVPARISILEENFDDARAQSEAGLLFFPDDPDLILLRATVEIQTGDVNEAIMLVDQAIQVIPKDEPMMMAFALVLRGDAWGKERKFTAQAEEYRNALKYIEKFPLAYELLGHTYLEMGQFGKAKNAFKHAITSPKKMPWAHLGFGIALKALGDLRAAITVFYGVIEHFSERTIIYRAYRNLASCYYRKSDLEEARWYYAKALEYEQRDVPTLCDLTIVCAEKGDKKDAQNFLNLALKLSASSEGRNNIVQKGLRSLRSVPNNQSARVFHNNKRITDEPVTMGLAYLYTGILFESQEKYSDAGIVYSRALDIFKQDHQKDFSKHSKGLLESLKKRFEMLYDAAKPKKTSRSKQTFVKPKYVNFSRHRRFSFKR